MTISRNAPCICGSGKKYKKCCLGKESPKVDREKPKESNTSNLKSPFFESDIDVLSNSVLDLIKVKEFDKAKEVCQKLLDEYPSQVDGYERLASVYEEEGDAGKAAEYYRKTVEFMQKNPGFDDDGINWYLEKAEELDEKSRS